MSNVQNHQFVNEQLQFPLGEAFERRVAEFLQSEPGGAENMTIAVIDLDHFLRINEQFGRDVGDQVLIDTGRTLAAELPEGATIYRIAGDEFAIIFQNEMEKEDVFLWMEKRRSEFAVKAPDGEKMSVSIGVAAAFEDGSRVQELMQKAESAMYRAKFSGRNRVTLAREEKMVPKTAHFTSDQLKRLTKLSKREGIGEAVLLREALEMLLKKYEN